MEIDGLRGVNVRRSLARLRQMWRNHGPASPMCLAEELEPGISVGDFAVLLLLTQRSRRVTGERRQGEEDIAPSPIESGEGHLPGIDAEAVEDGEAFAEESIPRLGKESSTSRGEGTAGLSHASLDGASPSDTRSSPDGMSADGTTPGAVADPKDDAPGAPFIPDTPVPPPASARITRRKSSISR